MEVGSGIVCHASSGAVDLAPDTTHAATSLARFRVFPQPGDTAWIHDEGPTDSAIDDRWTPHEITSATSAPGRCTGSALVDSVLDATRPSWRFTVASPGPSPTISSGAPLRLTRTARFALYRGGTGEYWLGYSEWQPASGWITIQPVSGPYLAYNRTMPAASGVVFGARDTSGVPTAVPGAPAAVLTFGTRTRTSRAVRMDGIARGAYADSLASLVGLRNR
jgi:hypothetical protein